MKQQDLRYITDVLSARTSKTEPDWYSVTGFLFSHRIAGLFYNRAKQLDIPLPKKAEKLFAETFARQRRKVQFMRGYIAEIAKAMHAAQAEYVFLKGSVFSNLPKEKRIYADGERASNDIDILVRQNAIAKAESVLRSLGYVQGEYIAEEDEIRPFSRLEIVTRRMNRGETAPFVKWTGEGEFPFVEADINFSLGNTPGEGEELLSDIVGTGVETGGACPMRLPQAEMFFLHLIMHQYKESCLYFMAERGKELDLYKLADIYFCLYSGGLDLSRLLCLVRRYAIEEKLGAVLWQVADIFDDKKIDTLAGKCGKAQPDVIDYVHKKRYEWMAPPHERNCSLSALQYLSEKGTL